MYSDFTPLCEFTPLLTVFIHFFLIYFAFTPYLFDLLCDCKPHLSVFTYFILKFILILHLILYAFYTQIWLIFTPFWLYLLISF